LTKRETIPNDDPSNLPGSTQSGTKQTEIKNITKTTKIPVLGAQWIFNPVGSSYKDPDTKAIVVRTEATLQYSKAGVPQKFGLSRVDLENIDKFRASKEYQEIVNALPETAAFEPNTY